MKRAIKHVTEIIMQYHNRKTTEEINNGVCDKFAKKLVDYTGKGTIMWSHDMPDNKPFDEKWLHCFVFYKGKYYDCEAPAGVKDWRELPFFVRMIQSNKHLALRYANLHKV